MLFCGMAETPPLTLRELVDPAPFLPREGIPAWTWVAAAVAFLALVLLVRSLRSRHPKAADTRRLREAARHAAVSELDSVDRSQAPAPLGTAVSLALRRYLAAASGDPALFETHEEFLARGEVPAGLPPEVRHDLARIFATLARMKYASDAPAPAADIVEPARRLIDRIHAALPA